MDCLPPHYNLDVFYCQPGLPAAQIGGVHLRVDTIEQAIVRSGLAQHPLGPVGYVVGYAQAEECLHQRLTVIA
ncbi:hypothetical protein AB0C98_10180 [Streptomyces sp. NPDC048558]|uniref:hypothetical protein n=1 Tax=Streptomyces sp. NPDC048558 TaxID=3155759 RepID=UPI0033E65448